MVSDPKKKATKNWVVLSSKVIDFSWLDSDGQNMSKPPAEYHQKPRAKSHRLHNIQRIGAQLGQGGLPVFFGGWLNGDLVSTHINRSTYVYIYISTHINKYIYIHICTDNESRWPSFGKSSQFHLLACFRLVSKSPHGCSSVTGIETTQGSSCLSPFSSCN